MLPKSHKIFKTKTKFEEINENRAKITSNLSETKNRFTMRITGKETKEDSNRITGRTEIMNRKAIMREPTITPEASNHRKTTKEISITSQTTLGRVKTTDNTDDSFVWIELFIVKLEEICIEKIHLSLKDFI